MARALDYLGCSGKQMQDDVLSIVDALRGIGCTIVVFPMAIGEIQNQPHDDAEQAAQQAV